MCLENKINIINQANLKKKEKPFQKEKRKTLSYNKNEGKSFQRYFI